MKFLNVLLLVSMFIVMGCSSKQQRVMKYEKMNNSFNELDREMLKLK